MADTLRIKRRAAGGAAGAPSSLASAELAFNEQDNVLYYGKGNSGGNATSILAIAGDVKLNDAAGSIANDGVTYGRKNGAWAATAAGLSEAPNDGKLYGRQSLAWVESATKAYIDAADAGKVNDTGDTMTGNLTISKSTPQFILNKAAATEYNYIIGQTAGSNRWTIYPGAGGIAESGGNVGSDFYIGRHADNGAGIDNPFVISRATGLISVIGDPTAALGVATKAYVDARSLNNLVVNPAFQHSQELGFGIAAGSNTYPADQWLSSFSGPTTTNVSIQCYSPAQLSNGMGQIGFVGTATAYTSVVSGNYLGIAQYIEGTSVMQLAWGQAAAIPAVLTFEAYSTVAGNFVAALRSSTADRSIVFPLAFSSGELNQWKRFTLAIPAITTGTFNRDNSKGVEIWFMAMAGSNYQAASTGVWVTTNSLSYSGHSNLLATASQALWIRNVGLYPDPNNLGRAPTFAQPDYHTELLKCQRYWCGTASGSNPLILSQALSAAGTIRGNVFLPTTMRAAPSVAILLPSYNNASGISSSVQWPNGFRVAMGGTAAGDAYCQFGYSANARM